MQDNKYYTPDIEDIRVGEGIIKHFYSDDIRMYDNPMNGNGWDVPDIPEWHPKKKTK